MEEKKKKEKDSSLEIDKVELDAFEDGYSDKDVKKYEDLRTLFSQDYEAWKEAQKKGLDVKDSFRVMRLGNEGENPHYHVFSTSGKEKDVQKEMNTINTTRFIVDNKSVERFKMERDLFLMRKEELRRKKSERMLGDK